MKTNIIKMKLTQATRELATFNCGGKVSGVIHAPDKGKVTVLLDEGYLVGHFCCSVCAIDAISDIYIAIFECEKYSGPYEAYKNAFKSGVKYSHIH